MKEGLRELVCATKYKILAILRLKFAQYRNMCCIRDEKILEMSVECFFAGQSIKLDFQIPKSRFYILRMSLVDLSETLSMTWIMKMGLLMT